MTPLYQGFQVLWQKTKMNLDYSQKDGTKSTKWTSNDSQTFLILSFLYFFINPLMAAPFDQFFGSDEHKIREIPKYLKVCHKNDKKLDKCIKTSLEKFMKTLNSDSEELNLPNLDPIEIPLLEFHLGEGNVTLKIVFRRFRIDGFNHFKVANVKSNLIDNKFEISVENPQIIMTGQFTAKGGIYTFPISSQGDFYLNLTDVSAVLIFRLATIKLFPNLTFFTVENCLMDLLSSEINAHFGEFIDGSNNIGAAFNTFFNNNAHEIFTLIKPKISAALANIFASIADEILSRHPEDVLLPD